MSMIKKLLLQNRGFIVLMFGMLLFRSAIADWYVVPSSSMVPTLLIGDRVLAYRLAYDIKLLFTNIILSHQADPVRGDIVTFTSPADGRRLVKRLIAVPGDVVEMQEESLIINGNQIGYVPVTEPGALTPDYFGTQLVFKEDLPGHPHAIITMPQRQALRSFGPTTIPEGQYMMLGDNRDNSQDSRYIGLIRRELITGRVNRVLYSLDADDYFLPRLNRFVSAL